jgi:hypothetical protein
MRLLSIVVKTHSSLKNETTWRKMGFIFKTSTLNCFRVNAKICATWCYIGTVKINSFYVLKSESREPHVFKK